MRWNANRCAASCWCARRLKRGKNSASCLGIWRRKSTHICVHCMTRCKKCSASNMRSEEHTSELQSLMRISYAGFCLQKKIIEQYLYLTECSVDIHYQTCQ